MPITSLSPMRSRNAASFLETTDFSQHRRQSRSGYGTEKSRPPTAPLRRPRNNSAATFSSRPQTSTRRFKLPQRSRQPALEVSRSGQSGRKSVLGAYGYFAFSHRNAARNDDEAGVLFYTPAI